MSKNGGNKAAEPLLNIEVACPSCGAAPCKPCTEDGEDMGFRVHNGRRAPRPSDEGNKGVRVPAAVPWKPSECWEVDSISGWTLKVIGVELGVTYPHYRYIAGGSANGRGEWCWHWRTTTEEGIANDILSAMFAVERRMRERAKAILLATGGL